eukprot:449753_1
MHDFYIYLFVFYLKNFHYYNIMGNYCDCVPFYQYDSRNYHQLVNLDNNHQPSTNNETEFEGVDISIFKIATSRHEFCYEYQSCAYLKRICVALKYYDSIDDNGTDKEAFNKFCQETYINLIDDYCHVIKEHENDLKSIINMLRNKYGFKKCKVSQCNKVRRHYTRNTTETEREMQDKQYMFYSEIYDQIHHFLFHLQALGLRTNLIEINYKNDDINDINYVDFSCMDQTLRKQRDIIRSKRTKSGLDLSRYNAEHNKYNIHIDGDRNYSISCPYHSDMKHEATFCDEMYKHIQSNQSNQDEKIQSLKTFLDGEEYDTDAVRCDLCDINNIQSNIFNHINDSFFVDSIRRFSKDIQLLSSSFSTGFMFIYWSSYSNLTEQQINLVDWRHKYDTSDGYSISQLIVKQFYPSLKVEILSSSFVNINLWNDKIMFKAMQYQKTHRVKNIATWQGNDIYDIRPGSIMSLAHLCTIILYCDFSELCTEFSSTFRRNNPFETLQSVKSRNSKYYWFSKLLVEVVHTFGNNGHGTITANGIINGEYGPFYCGMSCIMNLPSFAIYLKGPCSTTKQREIAINFAKRNGMIIELQNHSQMSQMKQFFDCSFISKYVEEDERLWFAGCIKLKVQSVSIISTSQNFQHFFHAFYIFDAMISGYDMVNEQLQDNFKFDSDTMRNMSKKEIIQQRRDVMLIKIKSSDIKILEILINNKLNKNTSNSKFDPYVLDTFDLFVKQKTEIKINLR